MIELLKLTSDERLELFSNIAIKDNLHYAIVEKDYWLCMTLDYLFHHSPWRKALAFKGGTSLSKAYKLINRFSEDIDLILDWRVLGYDVKEPLKNRSNTKQDAFNKEAIQKTGVFLAEIFCPQIREGLSCELGFPANIYIDKENKQMLIFAYPKLFAYDYILPEIRLEIGALSAWTPSETVNIMSYVAEHYPHLFKNTEFSVLTVAAERTFWEKATILHHDANRPEHSSIPQRYSRHYYDLYCMAKSPVKDKAFAQLNLLQKVVDFKMRFYPRGWAQYQDAISHIKLHPPSYRLQALKEDYLAMRNMLYGEIPSFSSLMEGIEKLEKEIHELQKMAK